ncbi:MAG TPA: hypothetical protein VGG85_16945 [Terracidiphilus sp.]
MYDYLSARCSSLTLPRLDLLPSIMKWSVSSISIALAACLPLPAFAEKPISADTVADSVGINVHLHYTDTPYANFNLVQALLADLRVRHIRDGVIDTTWDEYYKRHNALAKQGIHCLFVTSPKQSDTLLASYPSRMKASFEGYEGPNEYNNSGDPQWPETLKSFMPKLYEITKRNPLLSSRTLVIGPSLTQPDAYPKAAGLQQYFDFANLHNYFAGRNPGTAGWGGGGYGSIDWNMRLAEGAWGDKPIMTTEIGYNTDSENKQGIPEDVDARYMPRLILEQLLHGIQRTYIYELIDVGPKISKNDAAFGLVRNDGSKKPAYTALKSLMELAVDPGSHPDLRDVSFQLSGDTQNVHHLLAQRGDGTYLLFFWIEQPSFDPDSKRPQAVPGKSVTFSSPEQFQSIELVTLQQDGEARARQLNPSASVSVEAYDTVSVLRLKPVGK